MSMPPSQCAAAASAAEIPSELEKSPTIPWPCRMRSTCLLMDESRMRSMLSSSGVQGGAQQAKHAQHGELAGRLASQESDCLSRARALECGRVTYPVQLVHEGPQGFFAAVDDCHSGSPSVKGRGSCGADTGFA